MVKAVVGGVQLTVRYCLGFSVFYVFCTSAYGVMSHIQGTGQSPDSTFIGISLSWMFLLYNLPYEIPSCGELRVVTLFS